MKVLILDIEGEGTGVDLAVRAQDAGHNIRYWLPTHQGDEFPYGKGLVPRPKEWESSMDWADLIVMTGNSKYAGKLAEYFGKGYPIFGPNIKGAELELDRGKGQELLKQYGIETVPYTVVDSVEDAIKLVCLTETGYAMKPWGGDGDKSMTCVAADPNHAIFTLKQWEKLGKFKGQLMMQELVKGVEIGIAGWFGPGGWNRAIEESFEHKKFMNDDLGENTGEMGTVIRHVTKSKLFDMVLDPITDYLHSCNYVGDCSVNCIIPEDGIPRPLEFTMRLGWPDFCIRQALIRSDPVEWMLDLVQGTDSLDVSTDIAVGVLLAHGDFPKAHDPLLTWMGYPIEGITSDNLKNIHFQQVMWGSAPRLVKGKVKNEEMYLTAGNYTLVVTGTGKTVEKAQKKAYELAWELKWPSNIMFRTDIGKRLEDQLEEIQKHGFATGMKYA